MAPQSAPHVHALYSDSLVWLSSLAKACSVSLGRVTAIAAKAGLNATVNGSSLDYGTDGNFKRVKIHNSQREETGIGIEYQAKATKNWRTLEDGNGVAYDMPVDAYNKLARRFADGGIPIYLILLCLPDDLNEWLQLALARRAKIQPKAAAFAGLRFDPHSTVHPLSGAFHNGEADAITFEF